MMGGKMGRKMCLTRELLYRIIQAEPETWFRAGLPLSRGWQNHTEMEIDWETDRESIGCCISPGVSPRRIYSPG